MAHMPMPMGEGVCTPAPMSTGEYGDSALKVEWRWRRRSYEPRMSLESLP
jgi:hypothetical protein